MADALALVKEGAGFLGAVGLATPWVRDYLGRIRADSLKEALFAGSLKAVVRDIRTEHDHWLAKPEGLDLFFTIGGLALLATTFAIGIVQALAD